MQGQPIIRRWQVSDDLPVTAPTLGVDDSDAWWAGSQRCFVGVVLASAAAALTTNTAIARTLATHTDERPTPPAAFALAGDDAPLLTAAPSAITFVVWATDESFALGPRALAEQDWQPPVPPLQPAVIRTWIDGDQVTTPPAALTVDEVYWQQPYCIPAPPPQPARTADDEIVPQPRLTDDYWQQPYHVTVAPMAVVWLQQDEITAPPTPLPFDEWGSWPMTLNLLPAVIAPVWHDDTAFGEVVVEFTADSRIRIGDKQEAVPGSRIGRRTM